MTAIAPSINAPQPASDAKKVDGIVAGFSDLSLGSKLMSMGILPGSHLHIVRKAPLGSGFYVQVDDRQYIALRKRELACILLQ